MKKKNDNKKMLELFKKVNNMTLNESENFVSEEDNGKYENVVFIQGEEANEPLQILDEKGEEAALEYLRQWHFPGEHEVTDEMGRGAEDNVYEKDGYIMSYNPRLNYIGLEYNLSGINEVEEEQPEDNGHKINDEREFAKRMLILEREVTIGKISKAYKSLLSIKPTVEIRNTNEFQQVLSSLRDLIIKVLNMRGYEVNPQIVQDYFESISRGSKSQLEEFEDDPLADRLLGFEPKNVDCDMNEGVKKKH